MHAGYESAPLAPLLSFDESRRISLRERLLDRLVDLMLDADEVLEILRRDHTREFDWIEQPLHRTVDDVDVILRKLTD